VTDRDADWGINTRLLHSDRLGGAEAGALHQPVHTGVAYGFEHADDLAAVFQGRAKGFAYARTGTPTTRALEKRVTLLEDGASTVVFSTGMAAIHATFFALCSAGDHVVCTSFLFGNTASVMGSLVRFGVDVDFVDATDASNVEAVVRDDTRIVFVETIANPRTQVADLEAIGRICAERGILYVVDNTMTSPWAFRPKTVGASLVVNSLTKHVGGHGNALGGAVTDTGLFDWATYANIQEAYKRFPTPDWGITQIKKKGLRDTGGALASDVAHRLSAGMETLSLRMPRATSNAQALCEMLEAHPGVARVYYPGLKSHPQYERAASLFRGSSSLFSFELAADVDCFEYIDRLRIAIPSTNLGDTRTLVIPVAHTIFFEAGAERREEMGIVDSLIRVSVGIEDIEDLLEDFRTAFAV
jgi:O-acetylhomoserine (thiol)-lyase